ncbi:PREDICTED: barH-like 1 homeobox protein [Gekko japonicus]|uniref:BarH-like 1 homeobox protein n=1 Tax=Gekko japonicus TaxID=146911 RepID=A0ABM1JNI5_GEKJA|nr:PREDICTED: barH-like 1 homeobox protein [Gekko japonicus]
MEGSNGFGIESLLSHRPGSPAAPKGDPLMGECRSPLELSPGSEISSGCPSPHSPGRDCLEAQRQGVAAALESHLQAGQISAPSQSRTVTSSFLIRDILADCKPLAACAPYSSTNGQSAQEAPVRIPAKAGEDFRDKVDKSSSNSSSDSEYKVKEEGDREISSSRESPPVRLKKPRKARTAFTDHQLAQLEREGGGREARLGSPLGSKALGQLSAPRSSPPPPVPFRPLLGLKGTSLKLSLSAARSHEERRATNALVEPSRSAVVGTLGKKGTFGAEKQGLLGGALAGVVIRRGVPDPGLELNGRHGPLATLNSDLLWNATCSDKIPKTRTKNIYILATGLRGPSPPPFPTDASWRRSTRQGPTAAATPYGWVPDTGVHRTKWKRQTAVGLELLAEAGNYSALQRMFPSPYFYPQSLVSNLDPGAAAALYLYRGPSAAPPPALQRPLVPRILIHGLQGAGGEPPPPLPPLAGVLPRAAQPR